MEDKVSFCWNELNTSDSDAAIKFYTTLFGWTTEEHPGAGMRYTVLKSNGQGIGGIMSHDGGPTAWGAYVAVPDVDALAKKVVELGGKVLVEPHDMPMVGRLLHFQDPQGARLSAITPCAQ